jgi:NADPH-dependent F420 reductase
LAGHDVVLGSRDAQRAEAAAAELRETIRAGAGQVSAAANAEVADGCDPVVVAVPYDGHRDLLASLASQLDGKIVIDCVNPVGFDGQGAFALDVAAGSAALEAQTVLPGSRVVGAFHHVSAVLLLDPHVESIDTDVLVLGDDRAATDEVIALACAVEGMRGIYAGRLRNARQVEALTANLISVNRRYKAHAGVRITDV